MLSACKKQARVTLKIPRSFITLNSHSFRMYTPQLDSSRFLPHYPEGQFLRVRMSSCKCDLVPWSLCVHCGSVTYNLTTSLM